MSTYLRLFPVVTLLFLATAAIRGLGATSLSPLPPWVWDNLVFASERDGLLQVFRTVSSERNPVRLTNNPLGAGIPALSPQGDRIAFVNSIYDERQLAVMNSDGSGIVQLTDIRAGGLISWNPDGTRLAFPRLVEGFSQIFTINADGSNLQQRTYDPSRLARCPSWSPDGRHIMYISREIPSVSNPDLFITPADSFHPVNITNDGDATREISAAWSPDGSRALVEVGDGQRDIWLYHLDGTAPQNVTNTPHANEYQPAWSHNGRSMVYVRTGDPDSVINIWFMELDGSGFHRPIYDPGQFDYFPNWGASGNGIPNPLIEELFPPVDPNIPPWAYDNFVFASNRGQGDSQIFRIARESGNQVIQVTDHPLGASVPVLSPGGDQIAFSYDIHGDTQFAVMNVDGSNIVHLADAGVGGKLQWSPDGQKLAFFCEVGGVNQIFTIDSDGTNLEQLTQDPARSASHPSWSPTGAYIMYVSGEAPNGDNPDLFITPVESFYPVNITNDGDQTREFSAVFSPDGEGALVVVEDGQYDIWRYYLDGTPPQNLTNTPDAYEHSPAWSPDGQSMAYTHHFISQRSNILFMHIDGTPLPPLIHDTESSDFQPSWPRGDISTHTHTPNPLIETLFSQTLDRDSAALLSAAGYEHMAFVSERTGVAQIYLADFHQASLTQLTHNPLGSWAPTISPGGDRIAFVNEANGDQQIAIMSLDGSGLVNLADGGEGDVQISWNSDGTQLSYSINIEGAGQIFIINDDGSNQEQVTNDPLISATWPSWGSSVEGLLYVSARLPNYDQRDVFALDLDFYSEAGYYPENLTMDGNARKEFSVIWSKNGAFFVCEVFDGYQTDLWRFNLNGSMVNLTNTSNVHEYSPTLSGDDQTIAFARAVGLGRSSIWFMDMEDLTPHPLISDTESTLFVPSWGGVSTPVVINPAPKRAANIEDTSWGQIKQRFAPSTTPNTRE